MKSDKVHFRECVILNLAVFKLLNGMCIFAGGEQIVPVDAYQIAFFTSEYLEVRLMIVQFVNLQFTNVHPVMLHSSKEQFLNSQSINLHRSAVYFCNF